MKFFLIFLLCMVSCASSIQNPPLDPSQFYKRDMIVIINGMATEGVVVAKKADKYAFRIEARGQLDLFTMTTCHKEETKERAWNVQQEVKSGLFGWGRKKIDMPNMVDFEYYPNEIESDGDCTMELGGYEKTGGRNSWAFIDFESPNYSLPAKIECNGQAIDSNGTTVCQTRKGLTERIHFSEEVITTNPNPCLISLAKDSMNFEFTIPLGKCTTVFTTKSTPKKFHKLTLIGYDQILIREMIQ